jgi:hypothetical protein
MKTNCEHIKLYLIDFIDKNLDEAMTNEIRQHLSECKSCQAELEQNLIIFDELKKIKDEEPPKNLRANFMQTLETEKMNIQQAPVIPISRNTRKLWLHNPFSQMAAGFAMLISGVLLGLLINNNQGNKSEIAQMHNEMDQMRQMLFLSKLDNNSASQRMQAVSYTQEMMTPNPEIIEALVETMNTDDNLNVRLASIHALSKFSNDPDIRDELVNSLKLQDDPLLQITLINILVEIQEEKAINVMKDLMQKDETMDAVKEMAEKGLTTFI